MKEDFIIERVCFHLGNVRIMNWDVLLDEEDSFGQHAMILHFDGVS